MEGANLASGIKRKGKKAQSLDKVGVFFTEASFYKYLPRPKFEDRLPQWLSRFYQDEEDPKHNGLNLNKSIKSKFSSKYSFKDQIVLLKEQVSLKRRSSCESSEDLSHDHDAFFVGNRCPEENTIHSLSIFSQNNFEKVTVIDEKNCKIGNQTSYLENNTFQCIPTVNKNCENDRVIDKEGTFNVVVTELCINSKKIKEEPAISEPEDLVNNVCVKGINVPFKATESANSVLEHTIELKHNQTVRHNLPQVAYDLHHLQESFGDSGSVEENVNDADEENLSDTAMLSQSDEENDLECGSHFSKLQMTYRNQNRKESLRVTDQSDDREESLRVTDQSDDREESLQVIYQSDATSTNSFECDSLHCPLQILNTNEISSNGSVSVLRVNAEAAHDVHHLSETIPCDTSLATLQESEADSGRAEKDTSGTEMESLLDNAQMPSVSKKEDDLECAPILSRLQITDKIKGKEPHQVPGQSEVMSADPRAADSFHPDSQRRILSCSEINPSGNVLGHSQAQALDKVEVFFTEASFYKYLPRPKFEDRLPQWLSRFPIKKPKPKDLDKPKKSEDSFHDQIEILKEQVSLKRHSSCESSKDMSSDHASSFECNSSPEDNTAHHDSVVDKDNFEKVTVIEKNNCESKEDYPDMGERRPGVPFKDTKSITGVLECTSVLEQSQPVQHDNPEVSHVVQHLSQTVHDLPEVSHDVQHLSQTVHDLPEVSHDVQHLSQTVHDLPEVSHDVQHLSQTVHDSPEVAGDVLHPQEIVGNSMNVDENVCGADTESLSDDVLCLVMPSLSDEDDELECGPNISGFQMTAEESKKEREPRKVTDQSDIMSADSSATDTSHSVSQQQILSCSEIHSNERELVKPEKSQQPCTFDSQNYLSEHDIPIFSVKEVVPPPSDSAGNVKVNPVKKNSIWAGEIKTECSANDSKQLLQSNPVSNDPNSRVSLSLQIIESRLRGSDIDNSGVFVSNLNIIDLAGSEKTSENLNSLRFKEGCNINKSLMTLATVIRKLSEKETFIPFRDSKLTRYLQNALGGNSKTAIILTISPTSIEETLSTLQFGQSAKKIKNRPQKNEVITDEAELKKSIKEIERLKECIRQLESSQAKEELEAQKKKKQLLTEELGSVLCVSSRNRRQTVCVPQLSRFKPIVGMSSTALSSQISMPPPNTCIPMPDWSPSKFDDLSLPFEDYEKYFIRDAAFQKLYARILDLQEENRLLKEQQSIQALQNTEQPSLILNDSLMVYDGPIVDFSVNLDGSVFENPDSHFSMSTNTRRQTVFSWQDKSSLYENNSSRPSGMETVDEEEEEVSSHSPRHPQADHPLMRDSAALTQMPKVNNTESESLSSHKVNEERAESEEHEKEILMAKINSLTHSLSVAESERREVQQILQEREKTLEELKGHLISQTDIKEILEAKINSLTSSLSQAEEELIEAKDSAQFYLEALEKKNSELDKAVNKQGSTDEGVQTENDKEEKEILKAKIDSLTSSLSQAEEELIEAKESAQLYLEAVEERNAEIDEAVDKVESLMEQVETLERKIEWGKEFLEQKNQRIEESEQKCEKLDNECKILKETVKEKEEVVKTLSLERSSLTKKIAGLKDSIEKDKEYYMRAIDSLKRRNENQDGSFIVHRPPEVPELQIRRKIEFEFSVKMKELEIAKDQQIRMLNQELKQLQDQLRVAPRSTNVLRERNTSEECMPSAAKSEAPIFSHANDEMKSKLLALEKENKELKKKSSQGAEGGTCPSCKSQPIGVGVVETFKLVTQERHIKSLQKKVARLESARAQTKSESPDESSGKQNTFKKSYTNYQRPVIDVQKLLCNNEEDRQDVDDIFSNLIAKDRASLAKAITLVESTHPQKKKKAQYLLTKVLKHVREEEKHSVKGPRAFRIGLSGPPGSGKSTFIETFGKFLTGLGHRVAVLAVDPSSSTTGGIFQHVFILA
ncbi:hypothetical protein Btru_031674 [Bulinus truncatus]|nr:hypothetical protein Btru_031674 [Bulinus truncatus]